MTSQEQLPLFSSSNGRKGTGGSDTKITCAMCCAVIGLSVGCILAIVALVALFEMPFIVPPGYVGAVVTMGHVHSYNSGLHFRVPFVSKVKLMTAKIQILEAQPRRDWRSRSILPSYFDLTTPT
eukprot:CAMPEP_0178682916 /NCGR_PEP_ID=MMETSP0699-20121125/2028_1 /TAXON_ID=265572 /ORGANISM="Extubocellulus spinifer, Strain CCMP396" /LENGTH=123 /DNA_ID=CAMNT_0020327481 /DNA_START=110 /DNA_END=477 /DNA_ORIENTATION=-